MTWKKAFSKLKLLFGQLCRHNFYLRSIFKPKLKYLRLTIIKKSLILSEKKSEWLISPLKCTPPQSCNAILQMCQATNFSFICPPQQSSDPHQFGTASRALPLLRFWLIHEKTFFSHFQQPFVARKVSTWQMFFSVQFFPGRLHSISKDLLFFGSLIAVESFALYYQ